MTIADFHIHPRQELVDALRDGVKLALKVGAVTRELSGDVIGTLRATRPNA